MCSSDLVTASDVSDETLDQLAAASDRMAMAYATTPPVILLPRVRRHMDYAGSLLEARKTEQTGHREISAWCWRRGRGTR